MQTPEETVSRITGACLHHLWEGRCVRHHSIIRPDNETCMVAQGAAEFIRARDAEMLAEFTEETRTCEDGYAGMSVSYDMTGTTRTTTTFLNKPPTRERRLVSPWKKVVDD